MALIQCIRNPSLSYLALQPVALYFYLFISIPQALFLIIFIIYTSKDLVSCSMTPKDCLYFIFFLQFHYWHPLLIFISSLLLLKVGAGINSLFNCPSKLYLQLSLIFFSFLTLKLVVSSHLIFSKLTVQR